MWRSLASNMLTVLAVALFLLGGLILWGQREYVAQGPQDHAVCVRVPGGATMGRISQELEEQGTISSGTIFRLGAQYTEKSSQLKAGNFLVPAHASMEEIVDAVTRGGASTCGAEVVYRIGVTRSRAELRELDPETMAEVELAKFDLGSAEVPEIFSQKAAAPDTAFRIAVAEGVTNWQVVEALKAIDILSGAVTDVPAEGMLAPHSYEITRGTEREALLGQMQALQQQRIDEAWAKRQEGLPFDTPEQMLVLASIIEKETGIPDERGAVASVFVNRLKSGMRLQTDPTVIYGITKGEGVLGRGLRQSELRRVTPWNTYVIEGLPPTPIANPGLASLEAAVNPDQTDYVFFVADGTGGHLFSSTLAEHNRNVAKWRQIEAERAKQND
ncbi:endolytic transglycosylase MltG [Pseudodonghicola xiamenensis]|uniref:Endolytic murein transglycosylase n=1 Tax=Pseudodonghicola xiamenensis TaxID=337702 RepID=A0A8J3H4X4_9RHOB|nr:endolytic transglycosylase MltG [Pseudodonghicola xiamenensis]GHG79805.1 branched-chain alpha-keto acid dehydrogenase subunit E2 [Pseudodonghicola xiamenensis]